MRHLMRNFMHATSTAPHLAVLSLISPFSQKNHLKVLLFLFKLLSMWNLHSAFVTESSNMSNVMVFSDLVISTQHSEV